MTSEPSRLTAFLVERMPFTVYPCGLFTPPSMLTTSSTLWSGATTPGRIRNSSSALRLMTDRFSICPRSDDVFAGAGFGLDDIPSGRDDDRLLLRANFQANRDVTRVVGAEHDATLLQVLKPERSIFRS